MEDTVELEETSIPHGQLFHLQINLRAWLMGRRIESEKCEISLFLNPENPSSRQRTIDWTGPVHEPRMIMIVFLISTYDALKAQICDFIKERLRDYAVRQDASKRTVVTLAGEVWFIRKTFTSISSRRLLTNELIFAYQAYLKNFIH